MKANGKTILVTGAGSGMGRALTLQLLEMGAKVVAIDLNEESLNETASLSTVKKERLYTKVLNITDRDAVFALPELLKEEFDEVDGIINNAGIIQPFINIEDLEIDKINQVMDVNFNGTLYFVKAFLPHLRKRPEAHIVNISSMGGFLPVPGQSIYGASKAAVKLLTEGLSSELRDTNVNVTVVFPGAIETNITENSGIERPGNRGGSAAGAGGESGDGLEDGAATGDAEKSKFQPLPAVEAAKIIIEGMENNDYRVTVGKDATFLDRFSRFSPKRAAEFIAKKMASLKS